ncbi:hypothetical protein DBR06_SOUSAS29610020, partial [Sousa chinensis]
PLRRTASVLVQFLVHMYKMKKPVRKAHMLKFIAKKYRNRFPEILRRASFSMEMLFGVDLKEVDCTKHTYTFVSKMALPNDGTMSRGSGLPKTGLLMYILAVILMKGNCATEENIWEFLNKMRVYAGKRHFIFGEPKKLITQDWVKLKYLEYRQVANSDPACYEFLWGPRAHAETSKMKVLEFLAKVNHTVPSAFQSWYEEALKDEEERAQASGSSGESFQRDPLIKKVGMLIEFLLEKYTVEEPIIKAELLKLVNKRYKRKFPEILRRAAECVQLVFGLELKEVKPGGDSYALVSKLHVSDDGRQSSGGRFQKNGLLMLVLGVIFLNGDCASEEEIWEFLNGLGVYVGRCHIIFGEPRKLITEDLVQEKYLVYRQVCDSDLPCYELLWGRRAHAETSKMKVLEFMAKVAGTVPSALPDLYEEALKDEEERARARARARAAARAGTR